jgi:hypothetical protein
MTIDVELILPATPGMPPMSRMYSKVREVLEASAGVIRFIAMDGQRITTCLPYTVVESDEERSAIIANA